LTLTRNIGNIVKRLQTYFVFICFNVFLANNKSDNSVTTEICLDVFGFRMEYVNLLDYSIAGKYENTKIQIK